MNRFVGAIFLIALAACEKPQNGGNLEPFDTARPDAEVGVPDATISPDMGSTTDPDIGSTTDPDMSPTDDPVVVLLNPDNCYAFSDDVDLPLAIDGVFDALSAVWRRPHDDEPTCPASGLLPSTAALVPYLAVKFCNEDSVEHAYDFEFIGQAGGGGEPPLDDAYLVLYEGEGLPTDHTQCLEANDDADGAIDAGDSEILGVTVQPGGAITVVATTYTFDAADGAGTGGYILIVSNAD